MAIGDFDKLTAHDLLRRMKARELSPVEVVQESLSRAERSASTLNPFVTLTPELALAAAKDAESAYARGEMKGPLQGLPVSVKDLTAVKGVRFTSGSVTLKDFIAPVDSPASERLKSGGACIIGKTTTTEFGCKGSSDSPLTGVTRSPWNHARTTGGSSAGAGASVAAGITPFALGTDGGGSIRIPSSFCGLFGIKAQFGRVPIYPAAATPTLAHVGPMSRTVRDSALLLQAIAGYDARDPAAVSQPVPDFVAACERPPRKGLRIAWSPTLGYARPTAEVARVAGEAARAFEQFDCKVEQVDKVFDDPVDLWMAEFYAGVGTRLKRTLIEHRSIIDPAVVGVLQNALDQTIDGYYGRVFSRYEFRTAFLSFFDRYDLLLTPTTPTAAFENGLDVPPELAGSNIVSWVSYTYPVNLCGFPAASVPCGFSSQGLPIGLHLVAPPLREDTIFSAAAAFEQVNPWIGTYPSAA